jgi:signal transduction histidine kinase
VNPVASRTAAIVQRFTGGSTSGVLLRLLLAIVAICYSAVLGAFSQPPAEVVLVVAGFAGLFLMVLAGISEQIPRWYAPVACVVAVLGGVVAASTNFSGWFLFGTAGVVLLGRPQIQPIFAAIGWAAGGITLVALQVYGEPDVETLLWNSVAVVGVLLLGLTRRSAVIRREQQAELVERSRQLEQRSLELIEQTERTQAETARAAALQERNRIAQDLHDLLAHSLGGLVVQLDAADAVLTAGGDQQQVAARLRSSRQLAVEGLREARAAVRELRTDDAPTGENVADAVAAVVNGPVGVQLGLVLDIVGEPRPIPYQPAQAFAAVAREAITNINKHAPGSRATASLIFTGPEVRLEMINALGAGSDPAGDDLAGSGAGFGLDGMDRRMADVGGDFHAGVEGSRWVVTASWRDPSDAKAGAHAGDPKEHTA